MCTLLAQFNIGYEYYVRLSKWYRIECTLFNTAKGQSRLLTRRRMESVAHIGVARSDN